MTRDEAKVMLEGENDNVFYRNWSWFGHSMGCGDGCCSDYYDTIEEALDSIEFYCGGHWEDVS